MPKLNKTVAKKVADAESVDFEAIPDGIYAAKLLSVTVKEGKESGQPYWSWEFEIDDEANDKHNGSHQWVNTSLSDKALWKMNEVFTAFGVSSDTDTDELCGEYVRLVVSQRTIQAGARAGQLGNNVDSVLPLEDDGDEEDGDEF